MVCKGHIKNNYINTPSKHKRDRRTAVYEHKTDRVHERIAKQTKSRTQFGMQTRDHECNYIFSTIVMIH